MFSVKMQFAKWKRIAKKMSAHKPDIFRRSELSRFEILKYRVQLLLWNGVGKRIVTRNTVSWRFSSRFNFSFVTPAKTIILFVKLSISILELRTADLLRIIISRAKNSTLRFLSSSNYVENFTPFSTLLTVQTNFHQT